MSMSVQPKEETKPTVITTVSTPMEDTDVCVAMVISLPMITGTVMVCAGSCNVAQDLLEDN